MTQRLAYTMSVPGRTARIVLQPKPDAKASPLSAAELKARRPSLHPLDAAITTELLSAPMFGQLSDAQLARLLPLLAQRNTECEGGVRLQVEQDELRPRMRVRQRESGGLGLCLGLEDGSGNWVDLTEGRLLAGQQAFFLKGAHAWPVASPAPWALASWGKSSELELGRDRLTPLERDELVRGLSQAGVPAVDLELLAVQRRAPRRFIVSLGTVETSPEGDPIVRATLHADYAGQRALVEGQRPVATYVAGGEHTDGRLIERDLMAEEESRRVLRHMGFRFDLAAGTFVAHREAALRALDPGSASFPLDWTVERPAGAPVFHRDLNLRAKVALRPDRGLLDVQFSVEAQHEDDTVQALVEMRDLLEWLRSGKHYVRLADGSYVAPSARFRNSVRILDDLGAEGDRVLISPLSVGLLRALGDHSGLAAADQATQEWLAELLHSEGPREEEPPKSLGPVMRDYQRRGLDWLMMLHRHRLTGILADDMGLGKTLQTLALLIKVRELEGPRPSLVVTPTSVVGVWRDEALRFAPELKVGLYYGLPEVRHALDIEHCDLVVTSYGILRRDAERLANTVFRYVILDEAQSAKNAASHNAKAVRQLKSERRLALTGTPIENRTEELWAMFDFLAPGFLGSMRHFRKRYGRPMEKGEPGSADMLRLRVRPLVLRRVKGDVAKELPPKIESLVRCEMLPPQRALYDHVAGQLRENVQRKIEKVGIERAQLDILAALMRLRQICCSPSLLPVPAGTRVPGSAKLELFEELMREALDSDRRVVVFSQFVEMQKKLIEVVKRLGVQPLWLHGGTRRRDEVIAKFQDPSGPPVIIVSLRAAGTGLTLTRADTVMHYDPWWNPAVERQATDRTHRLGQRSRVTVYKLICARSIEERVLALAEQKEALLEGLLTSDSGTRGKHISPDDVMALLS